MLKWYSSYDTVLAVIHSMCFDNDGKSNCCTDAAHCWNNDMMLVAVVMQNTHWQIIIWWGYYRWELKTCAWNDNYMIYSWCGTTSFSSDISLRKLIFVKSDESEVSLKTSWVQSPKKYFWKWFYYKRETLYFCSGWWQYKFNTCYVLDLLLYLVLQ